MKSSLLPCHGVEKTVPYSQQKEGTKESSYQRYLVEPFFLEAANRNDPSAEW